MMYNTHLNSEFSSIGIFTFLTRQCRERSSHNCTHIDTPSRGLSESRDVADTRPTHTSYIVAAAAHQTSFGEIRGFRKTRSGHSGIQYTTLLSSNDRTWYYQLIDRQTAYPITAAAWNHNVYRHPPSTFY